MKNYDNPQWLKSQYEKLGTISAVAREAKATLRIVSLRFEKFGIEHKHTTAKGYRTRNRAGYILVLEKGHPHGTKHGYVFEHRLVMEKYLGRLLETDEAVHHLNGVKDDNRIENLELLTRSAHAIHHSTKPEGLSDLSRDKKDAVIRLYSQDLMIPEIVQRVGLCEPTISKIIAGCPIRCNKCQRSFKNQRGRSMHIVRFHRKGENKNPRIFVKE